ncbi:MAG TPA: transcriptional regulator [Chromatiales bacterium]|nr:transcriptional regulator [Chromatiales bacterium]
MEIESHSFFHALSDPTRLRCLAQPKISRHLGLLRDLGIVKARREGVWMHYHLHPELPNWVRGVLDLALGAFAASPQGQADLVALTDKSPSCATACTSETE